jgi:hypothetical protein
MQQSLQDLPHERLGNNQLGVFSPFANKIGQGMEVFWSRFFQAADSFAKEWRFAPKLAYEAAKESQRRTGRVDWKLAQDLIDDPTPQMVKNAHNEAVRTAFQGEMNKFGEWLAMGQNMPAGRIVVPFLRSVYHGMMKTVSASPLGYLGWAKHVIQGRDDTNLGQTTDTKKYEFMNATMGSIMIYLIAQGVESGLLTLTGSPPDDAEEKDRWATLGIKPYQIGVRNGPAFSYASFGPPNLSLGIMAELYRYRDDPMRLQNNEAAIINMGSNMAKSLMDLSVFSSISEIVMAATDDSRDQSETPFGSSFGRFLEGQITGRIPFGATMSQIGQAQDPYTRRPIQNNLPERFWELVATRMPMNVPLTDIPWPGGRSDLKPALDRWGQPVANPYYGNIRGVPKVALPTQISEQTTDPVSLELKRLAETEGVSKYPGTAPNKYGTPPHEFKTPLEKYEWQKRVGQQSRINLEVLFSTPEYMNAPAAGTKDSKAAMIDDAYATAKAMAFESMGIIDPGAEPNREPKFWGIKEQAARENIPWWQLEQEVDRSLSKWNAYKEAIKNGRAGEPLTEREQNLSGVYSYPGMRNKVQAIEEEQERQNVKKVRDKFPPAFSSPFIAAP